MGPAAFVLDFFIVGNLAKKKAFQIVRVGQDNPFHLVLAISVVSVIWMCPLMSLVATLLFKNAGSQIIAVWLETTVLNFPMAFCWQLFLPDHLYVSCLEISSGKKKQKMKMYMQRMHNNI